MKDELIGMDILEQLKIKCSNCNRPLAEVILMETNKQRVDRGLRPITTTFKIIKCPHCSGDSFITKCFNGTVSVGSLNDNELVDVCDTDVLDDGTIFNTLIIRKS